jgi:hypothetical protein
MDKYANMCDMTAGFCVKGHTLSLEIDVPTTTKEEHDKVAEAIKKTIENMGYKVSWIASL